MATVAELTPGDLVTSGEHSAVFIARTRHPEYPTLMLVVWRLGKSLGGGWSFDALDPGQEVGDITRATIRQRTDRLRWALTGKAEWLTPAPHRRWAGSSWPSCG